MLIGKNLIYPTDFTVEQLEKLFQQISCLVFRADDLF